METIDIEAQVIELQEELTRKDENIELLSAELTRHLELASNCAKQLGWQEDDDSPVGYLHAYALAANMLAVSATDAHTQTLLQQGAKLDRTEQTTVWALCIGAVLGVALGAWLL